MEIKETGLQGLLEINPAIFQDERGWFTESYNINTYKTQGLNMSFVQDNLSFSKAGVLRGLHFQKATFAQGKLVKVVQGEVLDVAVDIRPQSPTFGQHYKVILSGEHQNLFYLPEGFAHGFLALKDSYLFYKCTKTYNKEADTGIAFDDPELNIDWNYPNPIISEKDQNLQSFHSYKVGLGIR
jgi:dTDP-4-dehydrorhamnose 3,5-epimerase